jgi:multicomponent K+:H+ antiporter subunit G
MPVPADILISALLVLAGLFGLIGSFGLLKLSDPMARLHAPTKATTLGVGGVLIASMILTSVAEGRLSFHELLITLFLFATAPVTAHVLAKMHIHRTLDRASLPPTGTASPWATFPGQADTARPPFSPADPDLPPT